MGTEDKRVVMIDPQRMQHAEFVRQDWVANAAEGTTPEDVLDPQYWAHMATHMKPYDRVEVRLETGEWIMEMVVLACERSWAHLALLQKHDLHASSETAPVASKYITKWKGPQRKHCVIRVSDNEIVQDGFGDAEAARRWARDHEARIGLTT